MRSRDLRALEFDKVLGLVTALAVSEPGRRRVQALAPSTDADEVRRRLTATSELVELRTHAGSLPMGEFKDQNPLFVVAAMEGATLDGKSLLDVRQFVLAARHVEAFLRSRCERFAAVAELARSLLAPKELADALLKALADDGGLLDDASRELKRLRTRLRDERVELETRLARMLDHDRDAAVPDRSPGDDPQPPFRAADETQLRRADGRHRAGSLGIGRDPVRRTAVGG